VTKELLEQMIACKEGTETIHEIKSDKKARKNKEQSFLFLHSNLD
jgi:hypothetical protein